MPLPRVDLRPLIRQALFARYQGQSTHGFYTGTGGRLAYAKAAQCWSLPYAVFFFVDANPVDSWSGRVVDVLIQISIWAKTAAAAEDLASLAYDLFEDQRLSGVGLAPFHLHRDTPVPTLDESEEKIALWQSGITLAGLVQTI